MGGRAEFVGFLEDAGLGGRAGFGRWAAGYVAAGLGGLAGSEEVAVEKLMLVVVNAGASGEEKVEDRGCHCDCVGIARLGMEMEVVRWLTRDGVVPRLRAELSPLILVIVARLNVQLR